MELAIDHHMHSVTRSSGMPASFRRSAEQDRGEDVKELERVTQVPHPQ